MSRLFALFALLLGAPLLAAAQPLVTPAELSARLAEPQLRVVDIRDGRNDAGKTPYEVAHIAGSLAAPYSKWRGPKDNPGKLPSEEALTGLVRSLGIDAATPVVVVYEGSSATDFGAAARVYWTLKAAGVKHLSILNGGVKAWRAANLPLVTEVPTVAPSTFTVKIDPALVATQDEVASVIGRSNVRLLDARPASYFFGETRHAAAKTPGTLVGAKNVDQAVWFAHGQRRAAAGGRREAHRAGQRRADRPADGVVLQHRALGGDQLVRAVRGAGPEGREALSGIDRGLVAGRAADDERADPPGPVLAAAERGNG